MVKQKSAKKKSGKICQLSGKKAIKGWSYSFLRAHFNPTAKRRFEVNLQTVRTKDENGNPVKLRVAASVLKRCPDIRNSTTAYTDRKKVKRLKGAKKQELLKSLGILSGEGEE